MSVSLNEVEIPVPPGSDTLGDSKPVVLAVDDTPANLDVLNGLLRDEYKVKVALNGPKALELARKEPRPDIILLDIMMPEMSGYGVCEQLKSDAETAHISIIFVTAKTGVEDETEGLALGAIDYITKPLHPEIVKARLERHLASHHATRALMDENQDLRAGQPRRFSEFDEASLRSLIDTGEGHALEFKSTLRWNLHADRSDKNIENACLKTVAGYLNTDGGVLLIGVTDEGEPVGLNQDHFKSEDKLLLHWVDLIATCLGGEYVRSIRSSVHTIGEHRVLVVDCLPAKVPVFFNRNNDESFYVRMTNSTKALKPSEVLTYIEQHFSGNSTPDEGDPTADSVKKPDDGYNEPGALAGPAQPHHFGWLQELQKRRVIGTGLLYIPIAYGFTEITLMVASALKAPDWVSRFVVLGFIAGFPLVLVLSWIYDLQIRRTDSKAVEDDSQK